MRSSITFHIDDLWQHYACYIKSGVIRCTLFMVHYLCRMCHCVLHRVLWSHISILMYLLIAVLRSTTGPLFYSPLRVSGEQFWWPCEGLAGFNCKANAVLLIYSCSLLFCLLLFLFSLISFYVFLLWGWGLLTDRVSSTLLALHCQPFSII